MKTEDTERLTNRQLKQARSKPDTADHNTVAQRQF